MVFMQKSDDSARNFKASALWSAYFRTPQKDNFDLAYSLNKRKDKIHWWNRPVRYPTNDARLGPYSDIFSREKNFSKRFSIKITQLKNYYFLLKSRPMLELAGIIILGIIAQWLAWRQNHQIPYWLNRTVGRTYRCSILRMHANLSNQLNLEPRACFQGRSILFRVLGH
jgi:hypothetical protein